MRETLDRSVIAGLIPHHGAMCLLDEVLGYDAESITCTALNHTDPAHPLRERGVLPAVCGVEYAAQAMAVHGALSGGLDVAPGVLAAVRELEIRVERLDDIPEALIVRACRLFGDGGRLLYEFTICAGNRELVRGRAAVMLNTENT